MAYGTSFERSALEIEDEKILLEAKKRFKYCEQWEAQARDYFDYDIKFANADANNMYQWDSWVVGDRIDTGRPCLTINKTQQHNLQIINDAKQNKPGVNIRPVGDTASFEAAQVFQEVVRHIEYISNAENVYDNGTTFQVEGGIGYWRLITDYVSDKSRDQEIYIRRIKNPKSVYLDPDIDEVDGSDANYGFIFTDKIKEVYEAENPDFKNVGGQSVLGNTSDGWFTKTHIRIAEYYTKILKDDRYIYFMLPETGEEIEGYWSELPKEAHDKFKEIKAREDNLPPSEQTFWEKDVVRSDIKWYKIAGDRIIKRGVWLGKYIPIVRVVGTETVIDGVLDRKGHTRALLDPQRIYNVNSSANVEFGALQSKSPIRAPADAVEGHEEYYKTANTVNHAWLPYNHMGEDGNPIPPPDRMPAPVSSPAYVEQMKIAQSEMMMVSGQYQAQLGENENAKSGIAINARQRQGDRATYHFIDNLAIAVRYTGKQLIDLIPKIYDTKRIIRIEAKDGSVMDVTIDPKAAQAYQKLPPPDDQQTDNTAIIHQIIFNPNIGTYDIQSDTGPSYATRRQEAFNALTQIAAQNKEFMNVAGDILWKVADFPEAQVLAQRWRRIIPPQVLGDAPNPQTEELMHKASDQIQMLQGQLAAMVKKVEDREREFAIKEREVMIREQQFMHDKQVDAVSEIREDYKALSARITALGNSGPAISMEQITPLVKQAVIEALQGGLPTDNDLPGIHEGGTPIVPPTEPATDATAG